MTDAAPVPEIKPANKRGAARLGAVQALYQMDVAKVPLADVMVEFEAYRLGCEIDGTQYRDADVGYFRMLVKGIFAEQRDVDRSIAKAMSGNWTLDRLDATLRAILRCGCYELLFRKDVPSVAVISEYLDIAAAFFEGDEIQFANGVLDSIRKANEASESASDGDKF